LSIGFRVKTDQELHAEFSKLDDQQLIKTGKMLRDFAKPRPGNGPDENWMRQLKIARQVWPERHPKKSELGSGGFTPKDKVVERLVSESFSRPSTRVIGGRKQVPLGERPSAATRSHHLS
jgi:hypothetical protein